MSEDQQSIVSGECSRECFAGNLYFLSSAGGGGTAVSEINSFRSLFFILALPLLARLSSSS